MLHLQIESGQPKNQPVLTPNETGSKDASLCFAVLIPTYHNEYTVVEVVECSARFIDRVIVVDDGSEDRTHCLLKKLQESMKNLVVITNKNNQGKGHSMRTGFAKAAEMGVTHVITVDADGQHDPNEIPSLVQTASSNPEAVILGVRKRSIDGYPAKSRVGRMITNLALFIQCGVSVSDSQCGFRVYPIGALQPFRFAADRYSYESELLVRSVWAGRDLVEVPIDCKYPDDRVSHWRPCRDSVREFYIQLRLFVIGLIPWPRNQVKAATGSLGVRSRFRGWISPVRLWRELRQSDSSSGHTAMGVSVGVFIGITPLFGFHTLLSMYAAWRFRLHPVAVVLGSQVGIPPLALPLAIASIHLGHFIRRSNEAIQLPNRSTNLWSWASDVGVDWAVGSVFIGLALALITYAAVKLLGNRLALEKDSVGVK